MRGTENMRLVADAEIVSLEKVSVPPEVVVKGWANGHVKTEEKELIVWHGGPLTVDKGPVPVPESLALRIKDVFARPYVDDGLRKAFGYIPRYRITLKTPGHSLQILVISGYDIFAVYKDGENVGGRPPARDWREFQEILSEIESLLSAEKSPPNKAVDRMPGSVSGESNRH